LDILLPNLTLLARRHAGHDNDTGAIAQLFSDPSDCQASDAQIWCRTGWPFMASTE